MRPRLDYLSRPANPTKRPSENNVREDPEGSREKIMRIDETLVKQELCEVVRGTVEETPNRP
jgi:hypothetical protein